MSFAETAALVADLQLKDHLSAGAKSAARAVQGLDKATSRTQASLGKLASNLEKGLKIGLVATAGALIGAVKAAGDFEASMHTINTVANLTPAELAGVGSALRDISKQTGIALSDITSGYYDLVSAGVKGKLAQEALNDAVKLGIGGLATTGEAIDLLTTAINAYHLDVKGAAKATDQFALAVADGKVKASEIAATFAQVASVAKAYGVGIDTIAASYAYLTAQGVPAAEVTTELQRAIVSIVSPTSDLAAAAKKLGVSFEKDLREKGIVPTLQEIRDYSEKTGIPLNKLLGRIEAVKFLLQTTGPQAAGFTAELDKMRKTSGVAAQQMAERQQGLNFQLARLKALALDAGITIGSALLPKLTPLVAKLNTFISAHAGDITAFGTKLAKGFTDLADAAGKVDWSGITSGLQLTGRVTKQIVESFLALPPDIQKLAVAALAINKVGGGIISSGIKDILGLALGSLKTITAANVTVIGGNVTGGGVPGVAGGKGGIGGVLGKGVQFILPIGVGILIANAIREAAGIPADSGNPEKGQFGPRNGTQGTTAKKLADLVDAANRNADATKTGAQTVAEEIARAQREAAAGDAERLNGSTSSINRSQMTAAEQIQAAIAAAGSKTAAATTATGYVVTGATKHAGMGIAGSVTHAGRVVAAAARHAGVTAKSGGLAGGRIAASAIARKKLSVTVYETTSVSVKMSAREVQSFLVKHKAGSVVR